MYVVVSGFFSGALLLTFFSQIPNLFLSLSLLIFILVAYFFYYRFKRFIKPLCNPLISFLFVFFLSALVSFIYASIMANSIIDTRLQSQFEGKNLIIEGVIANIPQYQQGRWRFYLDVQRVKLAQANTDLENFHLKGKIKLSWYRQLGSPQKIIKAGQRWRFQVRLKRPNGFMNQGGFDYEKWLFTKRIKAVGYIRTSEDNILLAASPWYSINYQRQQLAEKINGSFDNISKEAKAIIVALAVANRNNMSEQQWKLLQQTGTSHLIAISGLHIGLVAGFGYLLIAILWWLFPSLYQQVPVRIAGAFLAIFLVILYALLAGFTLPTQRSLIMVVGIVIALLQRQYIVNFQILSLAIILVLLIDPFAPMNASFWLSFSAVLLILGYAHRRLTKPRFSLFKLQLVLSLGMFPLTIFFFGSAAIISPLANLIAIPWVMLLIVPLILLLMPLLFIAPLFANYLLQFIAFNIDSLMQLLSMLNALPFTLLELQMLPISLILIMILGLLLLFLPKGFPAKWLGVVLFIPIVTYQPKRVEEGAFKYSLLDVGQGLASLIETKHYRLIYDTGPKINDHFDTGKLVLLPFLYSKGITHIDKMVLSHKDMDHRGGALAVLREITNDEVISSHKGVLPNLNMTECQAGQKWQWDKVSFEFLHPATQGAFSKKDVSKNNRSCVLRVSNQNHSLLLTGDIGKQVETHLLTTQAGKLKTEVLVIPHHGSKTSSSRAFITAVRPRLALNSVGYRNRFKHPAKKIIARYQEMEIPVFDTVNKGQISVFFPANEKALQLNFYRDENLRFWHRR